MYITFNKNTKKVAYVGEKKPISYTNNLTFAETDNVPKEYDYLLAINERDEARSYTCIEVVDDKEVEVEKVEYVKKVDLLAQFNLSTIQEQIKNDLILNGN